MKITSTKKMLLDARKNKYAVPAFNIHNLETMQAVVDGADRMRSPLILATTPGTVNYADMDYIVAMANVAAKKHNIPIALHLDHCTDIDFIKRCILAGYSSVMMDGSLKSYQENIDMTKEVVEFAHRYGVTVEAELGVVGGQEDERNIKEEETMLTDPKMALDFVTKTNIDSLAIAIGTAHGIYRLEPKLDFPRLKKVNDILDIPLVLHGGSGIPSESIKKAVQWGISKVNIATELKLPFSDAIKKYFHNHPEANDPRHYLKPGKEAIVKVVMEKIKICGSENRA